MRRKARAVTKGRDFARLCRIDAASMLRAIERFLVSRDEGGGFAAFMRTIRRRTAHDGPLELQSDPEAMRFLQRLGVVSNAKGSSAAEELAGFLEDASRSGAYDAATSSVLVRAFASGIYGVSPEPICGDAPRCGECPLADGCRERSGGAVAPYAEGDTPVERLAAKGPSALSTEELLSVLVGGRSRPEEVVRTCARVLAARSGLRGLAESSLEELAGSGLGARGARLVAAAMELARRWAAEPRPVGRPFRSGADFFAFYRLKLRDLKKENFIAVLLDQKNRFIADEVCSEGTLTSSLVHPREVFRRAIRESAAAVAFVHNHPSGDPTPSRQDMEITARLAEVAKLVGLRLLDHVIVGDSSYVSFVERGWL